MLGNLVEHFVLFRPSHASTEILARFIVPQARPLTLGDKFKTHIYHAHSCTVGLFYVPAHTRE